MADQQTPPSEAESQQRRLRVLSELAQSRLGDSLKTPVVTPPVFAISRVAPTPPKKRHAALWLGVLAALVTLGVVGVLALRAAPPHPTQAKAPHPLDISLAANGLVCPQGAAWSPDGKQIAVVGYAAGCPNEFPQGYTYHPGVLNIYDVASGALVKSLQPNDLIQPRLGLPSLPAPQVVNYSAVLWSPDGRRLALPFFAFQWAQTPCFTPGPVVVGVLLLNSDTTHPQALMRGPKTNDFSAGMWDLTDKTQISGGPVAVPATAYHWSADGRLIPTGALPTSGSPAVASPLAIAPIGSPSSDKPFTIWQSASVEAHPGAFLFGANCQADQRPIIPAAYTAQVEFSAWSPDGRYLAPDAGFEGVVQPQDKSAPTTQGLADLRLTQTARLPLRDAALQHVVSMLGSDSNNANSNMARVAWRPDGQVLASYHKLISNTIISYDHVVTLYDCATGRELATLTPAQFNGQNEDQQFQNSRVYWSPTATHLLLLDAQTNALRIWGANFLP